MAEKLYAVIQKFSPRTEEETRAKAELLHLVKTYGEELLFRSCEAGHITCSGFILSPDGQETLMAYHLIYQSVGWTGGHADGDADLLGVAIREAKEETSVTQIVPLTRSILSIDILPVPPHTKRGKSVPAHLHYNVTYGLIAPKGQKIADKPDENRDVMWIPVKEIPMHCTEPQMLPIYAKLVQRMQEIQRQKAAIPERMLVPLLEWYQKSHRDLPWRQDTEPYHVWISEIMLQQTRVEAVKEAYRRFLERLPDVQSLAACPDDVLMKLWEGLGYYSRARNLKKAANQIMTEYGGNFPRTYASIRKLSGIGEYTAGAIGSVCFGLPTPAVDGNVLRVMARLCELSENILAPSCKKQVTEMLAAVYPSVSDRGMLTQALMELGATVCVPNGVPRCEECPLSGLCMAKQNGSTGSLPIREKKIRRREEQRTVCILVCDGKIAIHKRPDTGLLASMWELPNTEGPLELPQLMQQVREWGVEPENLLSIVKRKHVFTHITWLLDGVYLTCQHGTDDFIWASPEELQTTYSLPTAFRCVLSEQLLPQE